MDIQVLDSSVIDKIAAGEVLERPAQLVKELIENSLDAGATEIEIEVSEGGRSVVVKDNGSGIPSDQVEAALIRHATSKIRRVEDLFALYSFGFRGEALSSAASVSQMVLISRTASQSLGCRLTAHFGEIKAKVEVASTVGSEIQVSQLFDNVPARKKFLKSDASEINHIKQCIRSFGLSRPDVTFKFSKEGELIFFWKQTSSPLERASDVLEMDDLYLAEGKENHIHVRAFYGAPNVTLRQNRGIWIFVQGRWVQDRALSAAIMESYRNLLMHGEYPHCVLFLDLPPGEVDVNVHPTKSQVKFSNPSDVFRATVHILRAGLQTTPWLKEIKSGISSPVMDRLAEPSYSQMTFLDRELKKTQLNKKQFVLRDSAPASATAFPTMEDLKTAHDVTEQKFLWSGLQVIGQLGQTYIVAQSDSDFYLVDQHAAHERVVFERLMRDWRNGRFTKQNYLIPLTLDFASDEVESLMNQKEELEKLGLTIEQAGPESIAVTSVPEIVKESGAVKALRLFADQMKSFSGSFAVENAIADLFASMSCHSVIRAGQALSEGEMKSLLEQMDEFPFSSFCPHGRPVYVKKSFYQIEKDFGRIV